MAAVGVAAEVGVVLEELDGAAAAAGDLARAFLEKPFDATTLADAIESALSPDQNWSPVH